MREFPRQGAEGLLGGGVTLVFKLNPVAFQGKEKT